MKDIYSDLTQREGEYDKELFMRCIAISCESALEFLALICSYSLYEYLPLFGIKTPKNFELYPSSFGGEHAFQYYYSKAILHIRNNALCKYCDVGFFESESSFLDIKDCFKIDSNIYPTAREIDEQIGRASVFVGLMDNYLRDCNLDSDARALARGKLVIAKDYLDYLELLNKNRSVLVPAKELAKAKLIIALGT